MNFNFKIWEKMTPRITQISQPYFDGRIVYGTGKTLNKWVVNFTSSFYGRTFRMFKTEEKAWEFYNKTKTRMESYENREQKNSR